MDTCRRLPLQYRNWLHKKHYKSTARYWTAYATAVANGIRTLFWNETLQRYSGSYDLLTDSQQTGPVYSQLTPVIYGIENNASRAAATIQSFMKSLEKNGYWGNNADDITVDSMVYISLVKIKGSVNPSQPWIEEAISKAQQTLELTAPSEQQPVETLAWELNALLT